MSQLEGYLKSLNPEELSSIRTIKLKGQEKKIFDFTIDQLEPKTGHGTPLGLSETHIYKIHSILLRKIFKKLVPEGGVALLKHLLGKNNFILFKHELKSAEKTISLLPANEKESYYLQCFHLLIDLPYKFFDNKLIDLYGLRYLENKVDRSEGDDQYIKCHKLFALANCCAAKKNPVKAFGITISDLIKLEHELDETDFFLAKYYLYRTFCSYYSYYEKNNLKLLAYLQSAIGLADKVQYFFPVNLGQFLGLLHADVLFTIGKIDEAYNIYKDIFCQGIPDNMYGYHYHCEQYALVLIVKEQYQDAEAFLHLSFDNCIKVKLDIFATRGSMAFAKLYLSKNELKKAIEYINLAKAINEKSFYLPFDVQIRVLENLLFLFKQDFNFAAQLASKNLKFAQSQKDPAQFKSYISLWKIILSVSTQRLKGDFKVSESVKSELNNLSKSFISLYCNLLEFIETKRVARTGEIVANT